MGEVSLFFPFRNKAPTSFFLFCSFRFVAFFSSLNSLPNPRKMFKHQQQKKKSNKLFALLFTQMLRNIVIWCCEVFSTKVVQNKAYFRLLQNAIDDAFLRKLKKDEIVSFWFKCKNEGFWRDLSKCGAFCGRNSNSPVKLLYIRLLQIFVKKKVWKKRKINQKKKEIDFEFEEFFVKNDFFFPKKTSNGKFLDLLTRKTKKC